MFRIGIMGATGYMGGEVLRLLLENPNFEMAWVTSRHQGKVEDVHRNLYGCKTNFISQEDITQCDGIVLSLPAGVAMSLAPMYLEKGIKLIDLSADFRIKDIKTWEKTYGMKHTSKQLVMEAVYGMPELHREQIKTASLIANPGCFSSAAILGLAPLMSLNNIKKDNISVIGLSGTSGVGAELDYVAHHPEAHNNLVPYNVVGHRHTLEIEQELNELTQDYVSINFTPVYVPITRGILVICNLFYEGNVTRDDILLKFNDFYSNEDFVKVLCYEKELNVSIQYKPYPWVTSVVGTNYCQIGIDVDTERKRIVVFSALDNMGKGGAHVCVENLNLMFGIDETSGLKTYAYHPC